MSGRQYQRRQAPSRWIIVSVVAALVGAVVHITSVLASDEWGRSQIDLVESFTKASPDPDWPYLDATDRTSLVCGSQVECVQAVGNGYLTLLKFPSVGAARQYVDTLGSDGVQIDPLVIHFDGIPLSVETRRDVVHGLSGINASSPD